MILSTHINPNKSLYVVGSRVIDILKGRKLIDAQELHILYSNKYKSDNLNYNYFLYALDWLYILELIKINKNSKIKRCF
ncbi:ABC-three component system middle component 6 [Chryseobacterium arthrosphaerae]|uniref:ABC-three component system middle component 6 n=1 Tax=Chryseobacterium arthrosphaerae TaxID=651561 RepID=UPI003D3298B4